MERRGLTAKVELAPLELLRSPYSLPPSPLELSTLFAPRFKSLSSCSILSNIPLTSTSSEYTSLHNFDTTE
jgi:hypothetical protein